MSDATVVTHTPGPWQWFFRGRAAELLHPGRGHLAVMDFVRLGTAGGTVRFATWDGRERGRSGGLMRPAHELILADHPDARLIAAAPELLAACAAAAEALESGDTLYHRRVIEHLLAAIGRATGT